MTKGTPRSRSSTRGTHTSRIGLQWSADHGPARTRDEEGLHAGVATQCRSIAARCNFLAPDRPVIQYACKEICRRISAPIRPCWSLLKKLGRCLDFTEMLINYSFLHNADFSGHGRHRSRGAANKLVGRRIESLGGQLIKKWATTQSVIVFVNWRSTTGWSPEGSMRSSRVLEMKEGLGLERVQIDLGMSSQAAKRIATRRGVGQVKHLDTRTLREQGQVSKGRVWMRKIPADHNPAHFFTMYLTAKYFQKHLQQHSVNFRTWRNELALKFGRCLQVATTLKRCPRGGVGDTGRVHCMIRR